MEKARVYQCHIAHVEHSLYEMPTLRALECVVDLCRLKLQKQKHHDECFVLHVIVLTFFLYLLNSPILSN